MTTSFSQRVIFAEKVILKIAQGVTTLEALGTLLRKSPEDFNSGDSEYDLPKMPRRSSKITRGSPKIFERNREVSKQGSANISNRLPKITRGLPFMLLTSDRLIPRKSLVFNFSSPLVQFLQISENTSVGPM